MLTSSGRLPPSRALVPEFDKLPAGTLAKSVYHAQAAEKINDAQKAQLETGAPVEIVGILSRG